MGTEGGGLNRLSAGRIEVLTMGNGLPSNDVRALFEDKLGQLWIGTYGGLVRWHDGVERVLGTADGLPNDIVFAVTEDGRGNLWVGTDSGLGLIEPSGITAFTVDDGLFDNKVFQILDDGNGWLWMTSNRGISRVRAEQLYARARGEIAWPRPRGSTAPTGCGSTNATAAHSQPVGGDATGSCGSPPPRAWRWSTCPGCGSTRRRHPS